MKILLIGGTGNIGQRILKEALDRGYAVTAAQRKPETLELKHPTLTVVKGDLLSEAELPALIAGNDLVISAISLYAGLSPEQFKPFTAFVYGSKNLLERLTLIRVEKQSV